MVCGYHQVYVVSSATKTRVRDPYRGVPAELPRRSDKAPDAAARVHATFERSRPRRLCRHAHGCRALG